MSFTYADRISQLPPYLFADIDRQKRAVAAEGADLIDLGVGDPDLPTPPHIVEALRVASENSANHQYPSYRGSEEFRIAAAEYYLRRWNVQLDPASEVVALIGSKEGIAHFPIAFVNPGDLVICPNPGYPVYRTGTLFCGGIPYDAPLKRENSFLLDYESIPEEIANRAKVVWVNYPNNPTAATASLAYYQGLIAWAQRYNIIVCSDNAYADIYFDEPPPSILQVEGAKDVAVEFYSLSKTYNMTGWRVAFAAGCPTLVEGLAKVKTNVDSGCFGAVQQAGIAALSSSQDCVSEIRQTYARRRNVLCDGLTEAGFDVLKPQATFYCLVANPGKLSSIEFASRLLQEAHVVATPANGFGDHGEGFVRFTFCAPSDRLAEAVDRIASTT